MRKTRASLRKTSKLTVPRKAVLVNIAIDKPPNNSYFRCHRQLVADDAIVLRDAENTNWAFYYVVPLMPTHPKLAPRLSKLTLVLISTWASSCSIRWCKSGRLSPFPSLSLSNFLLSKRQSHGH